MSFSLTALLLVAACGFDSPPLGTFGYAVRFGPQPTISISLGGATIVVNDFAGDRSLTTTTSRYDAKTLVLLSAREHASCCGAQWDSAVTRRSDGSYLVTTSQVLPDPSKNSSVALSAARDLPPKNMPVIVNDLGLVPWIHHVTRAPRIERVFLPSFSSARVTSEIINVVEGANEARPVGVAPSDRALRLVGTSGDTTTLWYDSCSFVLDAIQRQSSLVLRVAQ